jgi:Fic family protein
MTRQVWHPDRPYDDLPRLPPTAEVETKSVLRACISARAALAELSQAVHLIPNQAVLISTLPLLEAQASSEIENVVTTADKLFQALPNDPHADPATREALRYREALLAGYRELEARPLGTRTAETITSLIKGHTMQVRSQNDVKLVNEASGDVIYTPPQGERLLRDLLDDWERFLHSEAPDFDPLVRLAVGHYQFEAIHPFSDGNGRTGRVLNSLYLIEAGLLSLPVLYLSHYILENRPAYYRLLRGVTEHGEWESWVLYMLKAIEETANWTLAKVSAIRRLMEATREHVRKQLPKIYRHELVDMIFQWPYVRIANVVEAGLAERQTASRYLKQLVGVGVLHEMRDGREKLFVHTRLLRMLTSETNDFAVF